MPIILPSWAASGKPVTVDALKSWCDQEKIAVIEDCRFPNDAKTTGIYKNSERTIYLSDRLPEFHILPTLAHETVHAFYEHDGHQPNLVERRIDEALAVRLVNPADYAYWEQEYGWHTGGIAAAMSQPRWLIEAYRRVLERKQT